MENKVDQFRRANFFTGLLATPQFWNDIQDYHFTKEKFYNRLFLGAGIVPGIMDELRVSPVAKKGGSISLHIGAGFAIDKLGRGLYLYEPVIKTIDYKNYKLPVTIYIVLMYNEILDEYYQNEENPDFQGYKKKIESSKIDILSNEPTENAFELARVYLQEDENGEIKRIAEPADYANPAANEIDTRFVLWAKKAREGLSPFLKKYFADVLEETYNYAINAYTVVNLPGLRELQTLSLTSKMLVQCGDLAFEDSINILNPIFNVNNSIVQELIEFEKEQKKQMFTNKDSFKEYREKIYNQGELLKYFDNKHETIDKILKLQKSIIETLRNIFMTKKLTLPDIELISYDLPVDLVVDDERYRLVDFLDFNDKDAETNHDFNKSEANNFQTLNQSFSYPDGVVVPDITKVFVGGSISFKISNLIIGRKVLLVRRTDIFHGNYKVDVTVGGEKASPFVIDGSDTKCRWRNLPLKLPGKFVKDGSLVISFGREENARDNFGKIWVYQQI
jgi:hypothetical protein